MTPRERIDPIQLLKVIVSVAVCALLVGAALYSAPRVTGALNGAPAAPAHPPNLHGMPNFEEHPKEADAEFYKLVRQKKGDYSRLTLDQRSWLDGYTRGNGPRMFKQVAHTLFAQKKTR
ncbi:MAG TPA: hypothetical protein VFJ58_08320 [Armatimonadota bacterium]|nr:hypothetical protein [Armatimonadota bacterium]